MLYSNSFFIKNNNILFIIIILILFMNFSFLFFVLFSDIIFSIISLEFIFFSLYICNLNYYFIERFINKFCVFQD